MSAQQYYQQSPGYSGPPQGYGGPGYGPAYPQYPQAVSADRRVDEPLLCGPQTDVLTATPAGRRTRAPRPRATIRLKTRCTTPNNNSRARAAEVAGAASRAVWRRSASAVYARSFATAAANAENAVWIAVELGVGR